MSSRYCGLGGALDVISPCPSGTLRTAQANQTTLENADSPLGAENIPIDDCHAHVGY